MICPSCGHENRSQARFCARCGAPLAAAPAREPKPEAARPEPRRPAQAAVSPPPKPPEEEKRNPLRIGGSGLVTLGALIVLFAFMLPWASCGSVKLSGLDVVTRSSQVADYGGGRSPTVLLLVPLGALGLLALGAVGLTSGLAEGVLPAWLSKAGRLLPLLAVVPGLCSCCPSVGFLAQMQSARSSPDNLGLGMLIQIEYGFWLTLVGLGISFVGIAAAAMATLTARRRAPGVGPPG
jgi:hypothetical protein